MGKIKVSYRVPQDYSQTGLTNRKPKPYPTCKRCGARLNDEKSIKRGYGHKCFHKAAIIVLEIVP